MVQGCITSFYVEFITEVLQAISSIPSEAIEEVFAIQARAGYVLDNDLGKYIGNRGHIDGSVIENFINTSINWLTLRLRWTIMDVILLVF